MSYLAEVIGLSIKNGKVIQKFQLLNIKRRFAGLLKIYTIVIPDKELDETVRLFRENMTTRLNKEWYITIHNSDRVIIVFRERVFTLSGKGVVATYQKQIDVSRAKDRQMWEEMLQYAKSIGVPENQRDFLPENFDKLTYPEG